MRAVIEDLISDAEMLAVAIVGLLVVWSAVQAYLRTRSWIPTIGAILLGAIALWGVTNVSWLQDRVEEDVEQRDGFGAEDPRGGG